MRKHYFQVGLKNVVNGVYVPPKGVVAADDTQKGIRASMVAELAVLASIPENERDNYVANIQHLGVVDIEA